MNRLYSGKCVCAEKQATSYCMFDSIEAMSGHVIFVVQLYITMEFCFPFLESIRLDSSQ